MIDFLLRALIFISPSYATNAFPLLLYNILKDTTPIDMGRKFFDGNRILGDGKSFEGFIGGGVCGVATGWFLQLTGRHTVLEASVLSLGALIGDISGSFLKRRMGLERGEALPIIDQLGFIVFSLIFYNLLVEELDPLVFLTAIAITLPTHVVTNFIACRLGLKKVPW